MSARILIVDDAPFIRELLRHLLQSHGHDVVGEGTNGQEAVELADELKPDIILMDIVMPEKSGIEAAAEILKTQPQARIIACSTLDQEAMILKALEAGCCHYVVKPFDAKKLLDSIDRASQLRGF